MAHLNVDDVAENLPFYLTLQPSRWPGSISCATFGAASTGDSHGKDEMVCHLPLGTTIKIRKNPRGWDNDKLGKCWISIPERKEVRVHDLRMLLHILHRLTVFF